MRDLLWYLGANADDFAIISAAFKQLAHDVELHFLVTPHDLFARLDTGQPPPSFIFASLPPDSGPTLDFLRHFKAHPVFRWVPLILISDDADAWRHNEAIAAGIAAVLRRPLHLDSIQRLFSASGELLFRPFDDVHAHSLHPEGATRL